MIKTPVKTSILLLDGQKWGKKGMKRFTLTIKYFCL